MKKIKITIIIISIINLLNAGLSYCEEINNINLKAPEGVNQDVYRTFIQTYLEKWGSYTVDSEAAKKAFKIYFGTNSFQVIWKWETEGDGKTNYLGVEEYPGIVKGIKRGLLVSEEGAVKMVIDRNNGFYDSDRKIFDFNSVGYYPNEVECIRLLFRKKDVELTKKQLNQYKKDNNSGQIGIFYFQLIDNNRKVIASDTNVQAVYEYNGIMVILDNWKVSYYMFGLGDNPYSNYQYDLDQYRIKKAKNLLFDIYNDNPDKLLKELIGNNSSSVNDITKAWFAQLHKEGYALYKAHKDAEAVKKYEEALKSGESAELYFDYANSLSNLPDRLKDSSEAYLKAINKGYTNKAIAYYNLACIYSKMTNITYAYDCLKKAIDAGYSNTVYFLKDTDLNNLRADKDWKEFYERLKK